MIILDEKMLSKGTIGLIGEDYELNSPNVYDIEAYNDYLDKVVSMFYIDDELFDKMIDFYNNFLYNINETNNNYLKGDVFMDNNMDIFVYDNNNNTIDKIDKDNKNEMSKYLNVED